MNGASGGLDTFAVQIAKAFGVEVSDECSSKNVDLVRSIGADHVIDYKCEDFTRSGQRYDFNLDNVANHSLSETRSALTCGCRRSIRTQQRSSQTGYGQPPSMFSFVLYACLRLLIDLALAPLLRARR